MNTPEQDLGDLSKRVTELETSIQEIRFHQKINFDALTKTLGALYGQIQAELTRFHADATAQLTSLTSDVAGEHARQATQLGEILRILNDRT